MNQLFMAPMVAPAVVVNYGPELAANPGFESGDPPSSWFAVNDGLNSAAADPRPGSAGAKSIDMLIAPAKILGGCLSVITLEAGKNYAISFWYKNVDATDIAVIVYDDAWTQIVACGSLPLTEWTYVTNTFTVTGASGYLQCNVNGVAGQHALLDDISVKEVLP